MADLILTPTWDSGIYRIETTDPVIGGEDGISNKGAKNLGNRTEWLKEKIDSILNNIASGSLIRQGVITGKHDANGLPSFATYTPGTFTLNASPTEPFIASISGGYNENGPVNYYAYIDENISVSVPSGTRWVAVDVNPIDGSATVFSMTRTGLIRSYVAPASPSNNSLWYNLRNEKMYVYSSGSSSWSEALVLIIGEYDSTAGVFSYANNIGIGEKDLYGRNSVHVGIVSTYAGTSVMLPGYLLCDGSAVSRTEYRSLFQAIDTTYGPGDGSTTFNLPDIDDTAEGLKHFIKVQ